MNEPTKKEQILHCFRDINYAYNNPSMYETLERMLDEMEEDIVNQCCEDGIMFDAKTLSEKINHG